MTDSKPLSSFRELRVYQNSYKAMHRVVVEILPLLPKHEQYDLTDQLKRSIKAVPRLIAEGYAKRHQRAGFQKYLDDALAESNETLVGLEQCRDIYHIDAVLIEELVDLYDMTSRQLYKLSFSWSSMKKTP